MAAAAAVELAPEAGVALAPEAGEAPLAPEAGAAAPAEGDEPPPPPQADKAKESDAAAAMAERWMAEFIVVFPRCALHPADLLAVDDVLRH
ncbi:hypothetical protein BSU04_25885 [Caballeronia sordidicola]|uniref:Uncharacterized protein n=1 Tax=Caballeronia sordidicola TaxID=196367 RepID=A0A226WWW0_CABSO|nr:hypothetical protein BSU04_25885 [Caballeronia sordidicola]